MQRQARNTLGSWLVVWSIAILAYLPVLPFHTLMALM